MRPYGTTARRLLGAVVALASTLVLGGAATSPTANAGDESDRHCIDVDHHDLCRPPDPLIGFGAGTTGGRGGHAVTVTTAAALFSAIADSTPRIVRIRGLIPVSGEVKVGSNKSIIGVGDSSGITGGGFLVQNQANVIFRNLTVSFAVGFTAIRVRAGHNVWIDHDNLVTDLTHGVDFYDGLVNITKGADSVTVSWNHLVNDFETSLIGAADADGGLDIGHEKVTFHHNWFDNSVSRTPSLRFGTGHVFNNFFDHVHDGIHSRMGAQMLIEGNVFRNTQVAVFTHGASVQDGFVNIEPNNDFGGAAVQVPAQDVGTFTKAPYRYRLDPTSRVQAEVTAFAGAGVIDGPEDDG